MRKVFMKRFSCLAALTMFFLASLPLAAQSKLNLIATTEDLASLAN